MRVEGQQARRRIQPELVSPSQAAANPLFVQAASVATTTAYEQSQTPSDLKDQAKHATENLGSGRRVWIDISSKDDSEFDYSKVDVPGLNGCAASVLKAHGIGDCRMAESQRSTLDGMWVCA